MLLPESTFNDGCSQPILGLDCWSYVVAGSDGYIVIDEHGGKFQACADCIHSALLRKCITAPRRIAEVAQDKVRSVVLPLDMECSIVHVLEGAAYASCRRIQYAQPLSAKTKDCACLKGVDDLLQST